MIDANNNDSIRIGKDTAFHLCCEGSCLPGVVWIADKISQDFDRVLDCGRKPITFVSGFEGCLPEEGVNIVFGIAGDSLLLDSLGLDLYKITCKREVYGFYVLPEKKLIAVAGSDKRGAIYGLFHISELLGVSPFVDWSDALPDKREEVTFKSSDSLISKEPSVRYRGFFINDEWPAFGTWCNKRFGGFNAEMYDHIFELLLRLKGNYLWPAMWASCFAEDGPGLKSAELADQLGVVMGLSHHEPCLRHGEEFSKVKGEGSPYGKDWSFITNREGITRFWADGLKRNGHLENVITVGMRGERDSTILGEEATLADNINLLRDVIRTQNALIRKYVNKDLDSVPRMLALYKEVEPYYYGDDTTPGLRNYPELDNIILMLCDDNHGYLRSLPEGKMRSHKGGFGMYYHFDYHGGPVSYEWINSTYLPVVCEQMSTCYEHGVDALWIVNVGDLAFQELPLAYFLDLAYDYGRWSIHNDRPTEEYTRLWLSRQFGESLSAEDTEKYAAMLTRFTRLMHNRRPEHLDRDVYFFGEARKLLTEDIPQLQALCDEFEASLPADKLPAFLELIGYNVRAGLNLLEMWLCADLGHRFAEIGAVCANDYADRVEQCLARDEQLRQQLETAAGGKWAGLASAEHIGFKHWNSEESSAPVIERVIPSRRNELIVGLCEDGSSTRGLDWTKKTLTPRQYTHSGNLYTAEIFIALSGSRDVSFTVECSKPWVTASETEGTLTNDERIRYLTLTADLSIFTGSDTAEVTVRYPSGAAKIRLDLTSYEQGSGTVYAEQAGIISIPAEGYDDRTRTGDIRFEVIDGLGRAEGALRLFPLDAQPNAVSAPYVSYTFEAQGGEYDMTFTLMPCSPYTFGSGIQIGYVLNSTEPLSPEPPSMTVLEVLEPDYEAGESEQWEEGVLSHARFVCARVKPYEGRNNIRFYGLCREAVLERITFVKTDIDAEMPYLGYSDSVKI